MHGDAQKEDDGRVRNYQAFVALHNSVLMSLGAFPSNTKNTKNTKNPTSLPYNGDLQEAMRKQDRPAIRILMQHQQKQQEKEMEQNSA